MPHSTARHAACGAAASAAQGARATAITSSEGRMCLQACAGSICAPSVHHLQPQPHQLEQDAVLYNAGEALAAWAGGGARVAKLEPQQARQPARLVRNQLDLHDPHGQRGARTHRAPSPLSPLPARACKHAAAPSAAGAEVLAWGSCCVRGMNGAGAGAGAGVCVRVARSRAPGVCVGGGGAMLQGQAPGMHASKHGCSFTLARCAAL